MINDKISIIVPVYNLENYIAKTLESICNQTYKNIEIVVVDDGSKDNSWRIICDCAKADSRIIPICQENGGVTTARLNGLKKSTGDWVGFVDGDDLIDEDMYELLIYNAYKYNADISHCGYRMIFADGRVNCFYGTNQVFEQNNNKGLIDLLEGSVVEPSLCNKLYNKKIVDEAELSKTMIFSIKNNEDLLMNFILFSKSKKSVFTDECKYQYIVRKGSACRVITENAIFDPVRVKQIVCDIAPNEIKNETKRAYLLSCVNAFNDLMINKFNKEYIQIAYNLIKDQKGNIKLLGRKQQLLMKLILISPRFYRPIYVIYSKYFQKKKYE